MIRFSITSYPSFGKWLILGNYLSNKEREIQEKLETIYAFLWLRITIIHKMKFIQHKYIKK